MKKIVVCSLAGGQGKTTVAHTLALLLEQYGAVLAVDADPQANLTLLMGTPLTGQSPSCLEFLKQSCDVKNCIYPYDIKDVLPREKLFVIPADDGLERAQDYLTSTGMAAMVFRQRLEQKPVAEVFDYCVIDSPPARTALSLSAMGAADEIIIPVEASTKGVKSLLRTFEVLTTLQEFAGERAAKVLGVLPFKEKWFGRNRANSCTEAIEVIAEICRERKIRLFPSIIESEKLKGATSAGETIAEMGHPDLQHPFDEVLRALGLDLKEDEAA